jgi:hypothetical protein
VPSLLFISAVFVTFVAAFGFLFGQAFSGHFSAAATIAGIAGLVCGAFAFKMASDRNWAPVGVYWACVFALVGVAMDAGNYYLHLATAGSYYAWDLIGPFAVCIVLFAYVASQRRPPSSPDT